jgi:dihydroorotase
MPNTDPPIDAAGVAGQVLRLGRDAVCQVAVAGAITKGRAGGELAPLGELWGLGVRIFTDDGACVADAGLMRRALEYARALPGAVLAQHCEDPALARDGHMHEGPWSSWLGIPGVPAEAESVVVARDIALAALTRGRVHFLHLSTAAAIEMVRAAKARGLAVTAEAAPHHFTLTDAACSGYDPVFKVNPPLRTEADLKAVVEGLADGTVDAIATDHAPHPAQEKERPFDEAPPGMLGLETALGLTLTELVNPELITMERALALLSWQPAAIAGLDGHGGPIAPGRPAHLCVIDPAEVWEVDPARLASRSRNTPYAGRKLNGRIRHTVLGGEPVVVDGMAQR